MRRLWGAPLAALGALVLVSLFLSVVPGDPVEILLGEESTTLDREALRRAIGLDRPWYGQLWLFAQGFVTGELRTSIPPFQRRVLPEILSALPNTLLLTVSSLLIALAIALPAGVLAATRRGSRWDRLAMGLAVGGAAVPRFWLGPVLILLFAIKLDLLPVSGTGSARHLVLPAVTLGTALAAFLSRLTRASMLDALGEEYVLVARAKGLSERQVVWRHAFPNALLPIVTVVGLEFGALLGGAIVTEKVFAWPGMGTLLLGAIEKRDYNMVRATVLTFTLCYVGVNLLTDVVYAWADPRVRRQ